MVLGNSASIIRSSSRVRLSRVFSTCDALKRLDKLRPDPRHQSFPAKRSAETSWGAIQPRSVYDQGETYLLVPVPFLGIILNQVCECILTSLTSGGVKASRHPSPDESPDFNKSHAHTDWSVAAAG